MSDDQKTELELTREKFEKEAEATNKSRSGKGTRVFVGATRGKSTQIIKYEAFDESLPDTLPTSVGEFAQLTGVESEKDLVKFLITGYNDDSYTQASDPIKEFVDPTWPSEIQTMFRNSVRSYSKLVGVSIEQAVDLIKPGLVAKLQKASA